MLSAVKWFSALTFLFSGAVFSEQINILIIGQSVSANCNEHVYDAVNGVFQIGLDGAEIPAKDPFDWADCKAGSMWIPLGREIVKSGMADRVVFMPIGISGAKVSDWRQGGVAFPKLEKAIAVIKDKNIKFDYAFWHQGSSDIGRGRLYGSDLSALLAYVARNVKVEKWLIAQHSSCFGKIDIPLARVQKEIGKNYVSRRFPGPDTNLLGAGYRVDGCHLNYAGQEKMAEQWLSSMQTADRLDATVQKESLIYLFK